MPPQPDAQPAATLAQQAGRAALAVLDRAIRKVRSASTHAFCSSVADDEPSGMMADIALREANRQIQAAMEAVRAFEEALSRAGAPGLAHGPQRGKVDEAYYLQWASWNRPGIALDRISQCNEAAEALEPLRRAVQQTMQRLPLAGPGSSAPPQPPTQGGGESRA